VKDIGNTGNFQVTLLNRVPPQVLHCKNTMGEEFQKCESKGERERLFRVLSENK
jgi:hypothetical protein